MRISTICTALPWRVTVIDFARLQRSGLYDTVMRLPLVVWATLLATASAADLVRYLGNADRALPNTIYSVNIAMRLSTIAFLILMATTVVLRGRPTGKACGIEPRVSALLGTCLIYSVVLFPRRELSLAAGSVSTLLILAGNGLAFFVLSQLGRSFSVMAETRRLATSGIYRIIRHPLYLAEEIALVGVVMQFLSGWTALLFAVQIAFQLRRMRNEEVVLSESFLEYAAYKEKTARLIPGIY
jgi:protein-S-isoprenylcysteine O-methyltransferase Ste14